MLHVGFSNLFAECLLEATSSPPSRSLSTNPGYSNSTVSWWKNSTNSSYSFRLLGTGSSRFSLPSYIDLKAAASAVASTPTDPPSPRLRYLLRAFRRSATLKKRALTLHINNDLFSEAATAFSKLVAQGLSPEASTALEALETQEAHDFMFTHFISYVKDLHQDRIDAYSDLVQTLDLRLPQLWYTEARAKPRRVIYHAGPTNSGKTYNALNAMREAPTGVYCGPLRLLAMEVYEACNAAGCLCNLLTGQERRNVPGAEHTSCTVEMVNTSRRVDVAVIDEIQVMGDPFRGWAWTRALLGVPADEVHVCGDSSAVNLVQWLCEQSGDAFELRTYDRFAPLEVEGSGAVNGGLSSVERGDCIVAFSRRDIFSIKSKIESMTPHKTAIIYGALPPEARRQQARLFNDPASDYDVLVASDAVGMGLNLNIRRIIFKSLSKQEGKSGTVVPITPSMVKQISGRAGRRGTAFSKGLVACLSAQDVPKLEQDLAAPFEDLPNPRAGLYPEFEHIEAFAGRRPGDSFATLLEAYAELALLQGRFQLCRQEAILEIARLLEGVQGLSLNEMFTLCMAPATLKDSRIAAALLHFARQYAAGQPSTLDIHLGDAVPTNAAELQELEAAYQIVSLWLWLSCRFVEGAFPGRETAVAMGEHICALIAKGLEHITRSAGKSPRQIKRRAGESGGSEIVSGGRMFQSIHEEMEAVNQFFKRRRKKKRHAV